MQQAGRDALLLTDPADIFYLTGYHTFEVSVHTALVVTPERISLQVPSIETGPAVVTAMVDEIIGYRWEGIDEVIAPLADVLAPYHAIGLDMFSAGLRCHSAASGTAGQRAFSYGWWGNTRWPAADKAGAGLPARKCPHYGGGSGGG